MYDLSAVAPTNSNMVHQPMTHNFHVIAHHAVDIRTQLYEQTRCELKGQCEHCNHCTHFGALWPWSARALAQPI